MAGNRRGATAFDLIRGSPHQTSSSGHSSSQNDGNSSLTNSSDCVNLRHGDRSSSGNITGKLPLPVNYFTVPQLSRKENEHLLSLAKYACKEVVYYSRQDDGPMKWIQLSSDDGVDVFQGVDKSRSTRTSDAKTLTYLRGACKIRATIDEIADFFKLDTPDKLSGFAQTVGKDLLDQKTLLTLATPTPDNPKHYVAVKWTAVESPSKLVRNRDFCYIECHDEFIDSNTKRRGWVRSIHSIRLPFCPPLNRSHGLVRGSFYRSGFIFTESAEKGCVDAVHTLHVDIKGKAPNWMKILVMKRRIKNIAEVDRHFQLQRLIQGKLLGDLELPAKDRATRCQLCNTRFGFFHRRRVCRKCGKIVCTSCGTDYLLDRVGLGLKKVRVCSECSDTGTRNAAGQSMAEEGDIGMKQVKNSDLFPVYDDHVAGSVIILENGHESMDEHEFYLENDDGNDVADMKEAKRMNEEFQERLKQTEEEDVESSGHYHEDDDDDDNDNVHDVEDLSYPPSAREQILKQMYYEEKTRREQIQRANKLQQHTFSKRAHSSDCISIAGSAYKTFEPTRPRTAEEIIRNRPVNGKKTLESHGPSGRKWKRPDGINTESCHMFSSARGRGKLSDLPFITKQRTRSRSHDDQTIRYRKADEHCWHHEDDENQYESRDLQLPIEALDRSLAVLGDEPQYHHGGLESRAMFDHRERETRTRFNSSSTCAGTDPCGGRELFEAEHESTYTSLSDSHVTRAFQTHRRHRSDDLGSRNDEALRLAMSAMRLYEEGRGPSLQVTEETRQAALNKMIEVYAREIERSHSNDGETYHDTRSDTLRRHPHIGSPLLMRQSLNGPSRPKVSSKEGTPRQRPQDARSIHHPREDSSRDDTYKPNLHKKPKPREKFHDYRNLSDLTSSAFQAFQSFAHESRDASNVPVNGMAHSDDSDSSKQEYLYTPEHREPASMPSQEEASSSTSMQPKYTTSANRSDTVLPVYDNIETTTASKMVSRSNSMYGVADSDTFSDMDLMDLPHLMHKDAGGTRNSFTDLERWIEEEKRPSGPGGEDYVPEPCFSDLVSPLELDDVQYVEDYDSESQSSDASSYHDSLFPRTYARTPKTENDLKYESETYADLSNGFSESMVTQNDEPLRRCYRKPSSSSSSLGELLSEDGGSDRSSLPLCLEFEGSQVVLEPDYLDTMDQPVDTTDLIVGEDGRVRRRSSIPFEVEAMPARKFPCKMKF